ncbi:MAG: hypothetical protein ACPGJS_14950 [Flammeovirgaceae bacterium]
MKPLYIFLLWCIGISFAYGQQTENSVFIKKAKKKSLTVFAAISYPDSTIKYKKSYEEFNADGQLTSGVYYLPSGNIQTKVNRTYKDGKLLESVKDKKKLNELEKEVMTYNSSGLLAKKAEFRNEKLIIYFQYYYGHNNRLDSIIWYDSKGNAQLYEYHHYTDNRLTNITEKTAYGRLDGKTEIFYHENGMVKEEKLFDGFGEMYEHFSYNERGQVTERKLIQDKNTTTYTYIYAGNGLLKRSKKELSNTTKETSYKYKWSKKTAIVP